MTRAKYPWKRFWCTRGGIAYLDHQGYLVDPELEDGKILNPTAFSSEELSDLGCVALLGAASYIFLVGEVVPVKWAAERRLGPLPTA